MKDKKSNHSPRQLANSHINLGIYLFVFIYIIFTSFYLKDVATESTQQDIVAATLRNEVISKKPISKSYLSAFMKLFMSKVLRVTISLFVI